jgi:hypothetical protein
VGGHNDFPSRADCFDIFRWLVADQYALPEEGMNDQYLEDMAAIAVRAVQAFNKIYDEEMEFYPKAPEAPGDLQAQ